MEEYLDGNIKRRIIECFIMIERDKSYLLEPAIEELPEDIKVDRSWFPKSQITLLKYTDDTHAEFDIPMWLLEEKAWDWRP